MAAPQKVSPFLWFGGNAEEAVNFYVATFKNAGIDRTTYYTEGSPGRPGSVMTISFHIEGMNFIALNGDRDIPFSVATSFFISCDDQHEIDVLWQKLLADGGESRACGWIADKFGVIWQIVPKDILELLDSGDRDAVKRVMDAMMEMDKLDGDVLRAARRG